MRFSDIHPPQGHAVNGHKVAPPTIVIFDTNNRHNAPSAAEIFARQGYTVKQVFKGSPPVDYTKTPPRGFVGRTLRAVDEWRERDHQSHAVRSIADAEKLLARLKPDCVLITPFFTISKQEGEDWAQAAKRASPASNVVLHSVFHGAKHNEESPIWVEDVRRTGDSFTIIRGGLDELPGVFAHFDRSARGNGAAMA